MAGRLSGLRTRGSARGRAGFARGAVAGGGGRPAAHVASRDDDATANEPGRTSGLRCRVAPRPRRGPSGGPARRRRRDARAAGLTRKGGDPLRAGTLGRNPHAPQLAAGVVKAQDAEAAARAAGAAGPAATGTPRGPKEGFRGARPWR